ncbi:uncharacterized protein LOC143366937 isoform X2 [Andrena cerasifolii]|uniref:uncharacterized protein LOC143366937 isoform X2 n=1 Tax=Andrena cerasifolii TaxID=2819439 RepID=UPI004038420C
MTPRVHRARDVINWEFPRCKVWLQACGREDLPASKYQQYYKNRRLCSKHFEDHMYMGPSKSRLLPSAIPKKIESDTNVQEKSSCKNVLDLEPPAKKNLYCRKCKSNSRTIASRGHCRCHNGIIGTVRL